MLHPPVDCGIVSFGYAFGEDTDVASTAGEYVDDPERVLKWGCHTYHRASDGVWGTHLGAEAATEALARAHVDPHDIDLVVVAMAEIPEYAYYDTAASIARELKIERTQTLLLSEGCSAGTTGLGDIAGRFALQPDLQTALFIVVNRVSEFHRNRMNVNNSVHSDGAVAAVIRRGADQLKWLTTYQFSYPEYADWFRTDYGSAVHPVPPANWSTRVGAGGNDKVQEFFAKDAKKMRRFLDLRKDRVVEAVEGACERAGIGVHELTHALYINDHPKNVWAITDRLGVPRRRTNAEFTGPHGHMGPADQLISLGKLYDRGDVGPGDLIAVCGISTGMRWLCTLVRA